MKTTKRVGRTGLKVSEICLGTMTLVSNVTSQPASRSWMRRWSTA